MIASTRKTWFTRVVQVIGHAAVAFTRPEVALAAVATVAFPLAVLLPFFTFSPSFGDVMMDAAYEYLNPGSLDPMTYSVLGGIAKLFSDGDVVVAVVLLLFSVLFPAVKLALLWGVLVRPHPDKLSLVRVLETLGPWSMADVFVVSVLLLAFKSFPGGTIFAIQLGYYIFLASVVASLVATWIAKRRLERVPDAATTSSISTHEPVLHQMPSSIDASGPIGVSVAADGAIRSG
jgi:paraquat-inducible protein A